MEPKEPASKRTERQDEMDRFWDIDALMPIRRAPHYAADTEATEIVLEPKKGESPTSKSSAIPPKKEEPERHFIPPHTAEEATKERTPDAEYSPENSLIRTVRLYRPKSTYRYYEGFVRDATRLWKVKGESCTHTPFFSYVPQYVQMNRAQLEWYLWWRENFRQDRFLTTDYSYLLLHAYEIINLSDQIDPLQGQTALCKLWVHYRETFHQLDAYLPEWICDYSLIHRLPPPELLTGALLVAAMSHCALKEFYVPTAGEEGFVRALLIFCSNYDYHKSKFCTPENEKLFDRMILGVLRELTQKTDRDGKLLATVGMDHSRMVRDAYTGALCAYPLKKKIALEYHSFSCSHELRYLVTDAVKYTENKIRAALGVRSRLSIYALPTQIRTLIDVYLEPRLPKRESVHAKQEREAAEYEKLYDLPRTPLSAARAAEIERLSWDTTERLVEAFDGGTEEESPTPIPPRAEFALSPVVPSFEEPIAEGESMSGFSAAMQSYRAFLQAALADNGSSYGCCYASDRTGRRDQRACRRVYGRYFIGRV